MEEAQLTKKEKRVLKKEQKKKEREKIKLFGKVKKWGIALVIITVLIFTGLKLVNWLKAPVENLSADTLQVLEDDWIKGNHEARITIIEYSDFQCLACANYYPIINRLSRDFSDELRIVYRHFPLTADHDNAMDAAKATEAAGKQGKFWEMHDKLFEKQSEWAEDNSPDDKFISYANELQLNEEEFIRDFESKEVEELVNNDLNAALSLKLNATPTFFINGNKIENPKDFDSFRELIEKEISETSIK